MADRINSRNKGSKNERDTCKWFENWTGYEFSRVPSSGGLRWSRTSDTTGDILCSDKEHFMIFPFSIECKFHNNLEMGSIMLKEKHKIKDFWKQARSDAKRGEKIPLLFMRQNGMPKGEYLIVTEITVSEAIINASNAKLTTMLLAKKNLNVCIFLASEIYKNVPYKALLAGMKKIFKKK